jgi:lysophospholipase L1-like esterase
VREEAVALRPAGWRTYADSGVVEPSQTYLRWRLKPGQRVLWNGTRFTTNSLGYRSPDVAIPKPEGTFRVVVLGSSNTLGHGINDDEVYVRLLERWLNSTEAGLGPPVEVINLAVSGESPSQRLLRLRTEVARLEPDWIFNDVTILDVSLEENHLFWAVRNQVYIPFDYIREVLRRAGLSAENSSATFSRKLWIAWEPLLEGAFAGWAVEARRLNVGMTLVLLPRADEKTKNPNLVREIPALAGRHGLSVIDLSQAFVELEMDQFQVARWDPHPNALGHQIIFEALRDALQRHGEASLLDAIQAGGIRH